jgi:hypothetical protein
MQMENELDRPEAYSETIPLSYAVVRAVDLLGNQWWR